MKVSVTLRNSTRSANDVAVVTWLYRVQHFLMPEPALFLFRNMSAVLDSPHGQAFGRCQIGTRINHHHERSAAEAGVDDKEAKN